MRTILPFLVASLILAALVQAEQYLDRKEGKPSELVQLRTEHSETYDQVDGSHTAQVFTSQKYLRDNGVFDGIPHAPAEEALFGFTTVVKGGQYTWRYNPEKAGDGGRFERGKYHVTFLPIGNIEGRKVTVKPSVDGIKESIEITRSEDSIISWRIITNAQVRFAAGELIFEDDNGRKLFRITPFFAWDSAGDKIPVETAFSGDILTCTLAIPEKVVWPIILDPSIALDNVDTMIGYQVGADSTLYTTSRNKTIANYPDNSFISLWVGQSYQSGMWRVHRSFLVFDTTPIPDSAIIDSAKVLMVVDGDYSTVDFDMKFVAGTFTGSWTKNWFNDFAGWASSGAYSVTALSATVNSSAIGAVGDTVRFKLNAAGIDSIHKNGETKLVLMSQEDINNSEPSSVSQERVQFKLDSPYLMVWYRLPVTAPSNFVMTAVDSTTIACSWNDMSSNEQKFFIVNMADSSVVDSTAANAVADTLRGLSRNTRYIWAAAADSGGVRGYSNPDTSWTLLTPPKGWEVKIMPISPDTLRVAVNAPSNPALGLTGMEVSAVSGFGATSSGWLTGQYAYLDGGLNPDSSYVYKVRFRNGNGDSTVWSPSLRYTMGGLDTLIVYLGGDYYDDYNVNFTSGMRDSTLVRAGKSDSGQKLDGFLSFDLPWQVQKGGVKEMHLTMNRISEKSTSAPIIKLYGIPVKDIAPVETLNLGTQDSTSVKVSWTVTSGAGEKTSPDLRSIFRVWQDLTPNRDYPYGFGMRLDDGGQADSVRAAFLDFSNPSYSHSTKLTLIYTPGYPDTLDSAPANLTLTVLSPDSIRADWEDRSFGEYGFVLLNLSDSTQVAGTDTLGENIQNTTVGELTPNTVYQWFVRAFTPGERESTSGTSARSLTRTPGIPTVNAVSPTILRFIVNPLDNPSHTEFAVQDSTTGWYADPGVHPHILREGPSGEWSWKTFEQWGGAAGDSLTGLSPNSGHTLRVKAR
ncbi:MAG: hypothetical protein WCU00_00470 [Candidatus Latescibacterota bacterium]